MCSFLERLGIHATHAPTADRAILLVQQGAAAAILTEESFTADAIESWRNYLKKQPAWSDLPLLVLTPSGGREGGFEPQSVIRDALGNVALLERPVRMESLSSAVQTCLRARQRQYQLRDYIEQQRKAEEALRKTEKLAVAGRLAASIAHEINNPLSSVTNLIYLICTSNDFDQCRAYATLAQEELQRVSDIVNQTLRFHRVPTSPELTDLVTVVDSVLSLFKARLQTQRVTLCKEYTGEEKIICSPGEIRQVLINLIGNALDAMPNSGKLVVRLGKVRHPRTGEEGLGLSLADTGVGIPAEARRRLCQPFFTTKGSTGTGLGLWITKDIIQRHQGIMRFRSRVGARSGTVFWIWLPFVSDNNLEQIPIEEIEEEVRRLAPKI
jgi:signal transduction histidine kinase